MSLSSNRINKQVPVDVHEKGTGHQLLFRRTYVCNALTIGLKGSHFYNVQSNIYEQAMKFYFTYTNNLFLFDL